MYYRKKPVIIEAFQFGYDFQPDWFSDAVTANKIITQGFSWAEGGGYTSCRIETLEGEMTALSGDFIIRGVKGEIYPCKSDIFEMTYEKADPF